MPNLTAPHNTAPALDEKSASKLEQRYHNAPCVGHASSQPSSSSPYQGRGSSQLEYGGGFQPAHMRATSDCAADKQALSLGKRTMTSRTDFTRTDSTGTPVQGIQSQKGSLHVVSPEGEAVPRQQYFEDKSTSSRGRLHLVGPEGVYGASEKPQNLAQPQFQHQRHSSAPPPQTEPAFVFELDATAPSKRAFIAELPADSIVPSPAEERITRHQEIVDCQTTIMLLKPCTTSAPLGTRSLPASLVAGGQGTHGHRQSLGHGEHPDESALSFSTRQTNAYRYSSYALPQSMSSETPHLSTEEATGPIYKAYRPFVATHELNRYDSVSSVYSPGHKRNVSHDSTASHKSDKLAKEYQELLNFEDGYGSN